MPPGPFRYMDAAGTNYIDVRGAHLVGSPGTAVDIDPYALLPDEVTITFSAVDTTAHTATGTLSCGAGSKNPYHGRIITGIPINGTAVDPDVKLIYPGLLPTYSNSGSFANGWSEKYWLGVFFGLLRAGNPNATQYKYVTATPIPAQSVSVGDPGGLLRFRVYNTGTGDQDNASLFVHPSAVALPIVAPKIFQSFIVTSDDPQATTDLDQKLRAYHVRCSADTGTHIKLEFSAPPYLSWAVLNLHEVGGSDVTSASIKKDGLTQYQVRDATGGMSDNFAGCIFVLSPDVVNTSTTNLAIYPEQHVWIAADLGGPTPTVWTQDSIVLGNIAAGGFVYAWAKWDVDEGVPNNQNPFAVKLVVESDATDSADLLS